MLSRLAMKTATTSTGRALRSSNGSGSLVCAVLRKNAGTNAANSERDLVNFPKMKPIIDRPKVRLLMMPENWFTAFHSKTGASA